MTVDNAGAAKSPAPKGGYVVFAAVFLVAMWRQGPTPFFYEESFEFWDRVPELGVSSLWTPWMGYLQVFGRFAYLAAHALNSPAVAHVMAALVIGFVAVYLTRFHVLLGLSLAFLPPYGPNLGAYAGPLNAQWWLALLVVGIALSPPRRWHYPVIALAGLTGIAVCLAWPAFRDRRVVPLLAASAIQAGFLIADGGRQRLALVGYPPPMTIAPEYAVIALVLLLTLVVSRAPIRTRLAFAYLGLATATLGALMMGPLEGQERYIVAASAAVALAVATRLGRGREADLLRSGHGVTALVVEGDPTGDILSQRRDLDHRGIPRRGVRKQYGVP